MKNKKYIINYLLGLGILLLSAACVQDDTLPLESYKGGDATTFNLTLDLKGMNRPNATRAATDSPFENISFLIFEGESTNGVIAESAKCVTIIENPEVKEEESTKKENEDENEPFTYTYAFQFKPKKDRNYQLVVIANNNSKVQITEESTYKEVRDAAIFNISTEGADANKADLQKYSFWGELSNFTEGMTSTSEISLRLQLIPAVAKLTVGFSESLTGWTVSEVFLYHGNKQGNIAYSYHEGESPAIYGLNSKEDSYQEKIKLSGVTLAQTDFYITEANKNIEKPARIVVGLTEGVETKYFRLDFKKPSSTELEYMDVVRNTHYFFTINAIHSDGSVTADEAAENISQKIEYDLAVWDNFINDMFYTKNGKYIGVGVGKDVFIAGTEKKEDAVLPLQTNYDEEDLRTWLKNTNSSEGSIKVYRDNDKAPIEASLKVLKEYGLSLVIPYKNLTDYLRNNEVSLVIVFQDDLGNTYTFEDLLIRYAVPIKSFKLTNAKFITDEHNFKEGTQVFYSLDKNPGHLLKVEYEYDLGGATIPDEPIVIRTPTIGGVWFKGNLKLGEKNDAAGKSYFTLTAEGKVTMNDPKDIAWNEEMKLFPIDASAIRKYFHIENEADIKDKLYCNIPFISNQGMVQYKVLLVNNAAQDHEKFETLRKYIASQFKVISVNRSEMNNHYNSYSHHATLFLNTEIDSHTAGLNKILELYDEKIVNTKIFNKSEFYRVFLHCSHGEKAGGRVDIHKTILGKENYEYNAEYIGSKEKSSIWVKYTAEGIEGSSLDNPLQLKLGEGTLTNKIKYGWDVRPTKEFVSNVYSRNVRDVLGVGPKYAYVHFFKGTKYNYFWAGTSRFYENKSMKNQNNIEMVNRILAPLKGLIKSDFLGKTPAMHYENKETIFGYPLVHFKIEYE